MIIPYGTDAPVYHWPVATVVIIVLNIVVFFVQAAVPTQRLSYDESVTAQALGIDVDSIARPGWLGAALAHGDGLHPVQWFTSIWMHSSLTHLFGNMMFLWVFGLVVEGKLGPWLFGLTYCGIGTVQCAIEQAICLGMEPNFSLGASSVIFGLMVLAMFWAPQDNIQYFLFIFFQFVNLSIPILIVVFIYIFLDFGVVLFGGFQISTPLLHVMGGVVGLVPAILFLKLELVDCEQRDIFSMFREAHGVAPKRKRPSQLVNTKPPKPGKSQNEKENQRAASRLEQEIDSQLASGNVAVAKKLKGEGVRQGTISDWTSQQLVRLIQLNQKEKRWNEVIRHSHSYIDRFAESASTIRINLARVYLVEKEFPKKALKVLKPIASAEQLTDKQVKMMSAIVERSQKLIGGGDDSADENEIS